MPQLPDLEDLGGRPTPNSQRAITVSDGTAPGRALQQLGQQGQQFSAQLLEEQARADDQNAVLAARRALDDWENANIYDPEKGAVAKLGQDAFDLPKKVPADFDKVAGEIAKGIGSPRAQRLFGELAAARRDRVTDWANRHAGQQREVYETGQFNANIDSSISRSAFLANAGDVVAARAEAEVAGAQTADYLRRKGRSPEEIANAVAGVRSRATTATVGILLDNDKPLEAEKFLRENAGGMRVDDLLRSQAAVGKAMDARTATIAATSAVQSLVTPALQPTETGRLANLASTTGPGASANPELAALVMHQESRGRRYGKDGKLLESPKGAKGEMQVMDGTNTDPGFGVRPAQNNSADERARVGRDYLDAMVKRYAGDVPKALAAYNAGPGRVDQALKDAAAGRSGSGDWLSYMPKETQTYVDEISKKFSGGGGAPAMPTLQAVHQRVRETVGTSNPQRLKMAIDASTQQYNEAVAAKKQTEAEAEEAGMRWLTENGGRFSQMPAGMRAALPPKSVDNLISFGQKIAKGDDITDPLVFNKMATDDAWLKGMSDAEFYVHSRKLSESDAQQMALRRGSLLNKNLPAGQKPSDLDTAAVNNVLNIRLQQMGMDPTPKDATPQAQRVGAIRQFVWQQVLQAQVANGKKFNDLEIGKEVDRLLAQQATTQTGMLWWKKPSTAPLLRMTADQIPADVRQKLTADFKKNGVPAPTDGDLLGAYLQSQRRVQ